MSGATAAECPGPLTLFQYANGHLDRTQSERIAMHVRRCSRCAERVQQTGNDGRSLADALEPRDAMALETAEDVLRRLDLDLELGDSDVVEVEAPPRARMPTPAPPARPHLPPPKGMRGKLPPPAKRPTPMGGPPLHAVPNAPPLRSPAPVGPPPTFASVPVGQTKVTPPTPASSGDRTVRAPAPTAPPRASAPRSSAAPPVPVVRTNQKRDSEPAPVVDAGRSRKWLYVSIFMFALLGVGAAGALILYPRLTGDELRWSSVVAAVEGVTGEAEKQDAKSERGAEAKSDASEKADAKAADAKAEPAADAKADAKAEPAADATAEPAADAKAADAKAEPAADVKAEPAADAKAEPAANAKAEPTAEAKAEPAADATVEPAADAKAADAKAEPAADVKAEPAAEAKAEPAAEAKAEPAAEAKAEPAVEPAADAKAEPAAEAPADDAEPAPPTGDAATPPPKPSNLPRFSEPVGGRDPGEAQDLAKRGALALRKSDLEIAETYFHRALAHDPRNATALSGLAALHFGQGRHRAAVKFAAKAVNAAPQDADLRILLGDAFLETLAYAHARREYEKAAALGHRSAAGRLAKLQERLAQP